MAEEKQSNENAVRAARALGWFSIGLGMAELLAPDFISRLIGMPGKNGILRAFGVREIAAGIAVLAQEKPLESMAGRVAGDAVDLGFLGFGLSSSESNKERVGYAIGAIVAVTALDVLVAVQLANQTPSTVSTVQTIAVNQTPEECYRFWRDFENLPRFMQHVESVRVLSGNRSHWVVTAPAGMTAEWDAELTQDSSQGISWQSLPGGDIENSGTVEFVPGTTGHGTIVKAHVEYKPPAGKVGMTIAKLFGEEPSIQAKMDLRRFKAVIETGEVPTIEGQSSGREKVGA